ncbi:hypothetical protein GCM10029992_48940 [Glycomyces albus]
MTSETAAASGRPDALLAADFYGYQNELTPTEREAALRLREFMEREVRPIADDYWERAEFPTTSSAASPNSA